MLEFRRRVALFVLELFELFLKHGSIALQTAALLSLFPRTFLRPLELQGCYHQRGAVCKREICLLMKMNHEQSHERSLNV
jgi:hypothetical protein